MLKMAAEEQPENANVLDSYAEALKADGQMDMALEYYRRILILQPDDERIRQEIKNLQAVKK
ncbi:MAG: tetratricopeptide repeat protein [Chitinophagaceae bacterium]